MTALRPRWIFFDLGDTLMDESEAHRVRAQNAARFLAQRGIDLTVEDLRQRIERASVAFARYPFLAVLAELGLSREAIAELRDAAPYDHAHEHLYPGTQALLEDLSTSFSLGLIANQSLGTQARLEQHGIGRYFSVVAASAELRMQKPEPEIFRWALERARCAAADALMVGDRLDNDIAPAKRLGMRTVRVVQGIARVQVAKTGDEVPDHSIESLSELTAVLALPT